jgi:hypothetical protein
VKVIADHPLRRVVLKDKVLLSIMGAALGISFVILACWQALDPSVGEKINCQTDWDSSSITTTTCDLICSHHQIFSVAVLGFQCVILLTGTIITIQIWNVHDAFAESRWLILAIYTQVFSKVYLYALNKAFNLSTQDYSWFVVTFGYLTWLVYTFTISLILLPKFVAIVKGIKVSLADFARTLRDPLREPLFRPTEAKTLKQMHVNPEPHPEVVAAGSKSLSPKPGRGELNVETRKSHVESRGTVSDEL